MTWPIDRGTGHYEWRKVGIRDIAEDAGDTAVHWAYIDPTRHWNGWACPYFELAEVRRMNRYAKDWFEDELFFDASTDEVFLPIDVSDGVCEWFPSINIDGNHLYAVGTGSWIWEILD